MFTWKLLNPKTSLIISHCNRQFYLSFIS